MTARPYTVDDLRGLTIAELDVLCSEILGLDPPDRTKRVVDRRPFYGPPKPPEPWIGEWLRRQLEEPWRKARRDNLHRQRVNWLRRQLAA